VFGVRERLEPFTDDVLKVQVDEEGSIHGIFRRDDCYLRH
jgi:hypothetical protein